MLKNLKRFRFIIYLLVFFAFSAAEISAQKTPSVFQNEIWNNADAEFVERHNFKGAPDASDAFAGKKVRFIYLVPQDRPVRDDYKAAIADAALHLQDFYQKELGGENAFTLNQPIVEVVQTNHTANWYKTNPTRPNGQTPGIWFWENSLHDGLSAVGGFFNDPNNRWIFYIDAEAECGQLSGGTSGVALMASNDLRGLTGQSNVPGCAGSFPDTSGKYRWIGGAGHEIGHAFNLPHPPGCDAPTSNCHGGMLAAASLMWTGYGNYPVTYFLAAEKQSLLAGRFFSMMVLRPTKLSDYDNDRKADISVWRPSNSVWSIIKSSDNSADYAAWGMSGDKIVPGDYDGDRKTDFAVWRPSNGVWYVFRSSDNTFSFQSFGLGDDIPVASDYDGDRKTDIAVWRPSSGIWYIIRSATDTLQAFSFGASGDKPIPADFNGDKRADIAVFRPGANVWYIHQNYSSYYYYAFPNNPAQVTFTATSFGAANDKIVPADYDGDGKAEIAVFRPSNGVWYFLRSSDNQFRAVKFGQNEDVPAPADYDGDGIADFAVWRPETGVWYVLQSSTGSLFAAQWGNAGDEPTAAAFVR
jgi:hypothetical protein